MGRRRNQSRAPRASKNAVHARAFIIDMVRSSGRFVTSVSNLADLKPTIQKHGGRSAIVSHWEQARVYGDHPLAGWHLVERFSV